MGDNQSRSHFSFKQLLVQSLAAFFIGAFIFLIISIAIVGMYQIWYADRILPGITIHNVSVGGMSVEQAAGYLLNNFQMTSGQNITLWYQDNPVVLSPEQIGISLDWQSSIIEAYNFGRGGFSGSWFAYHLSSSFTSHNIAPTIIFDQAKAFTALDQIGQQYDQPVLEANLFLQGTQVTTEPGQVGRTLNIPASLEQINTQIKDLNLEQIILPVAITNPQILDASPYAATAQEILNNSITLTLNESHDISNQVWRLEAAELAPMLTFEKRNTNGQTTIIPQLKEEHLNAYLENLAQQIEIPTENPRFIFNDDTGELDLLTAGVEGLLIDRGATKAALQKALAQGSSSAEISLITQKPQVSDNAAGNDLGITELVHSESSYFFGSSESRVQNIQTAAGQFHGLLIPPNTTFSMADAMDEISLDNGYAEALIIYNGQTIEGVGGGVCQVSTTLFRAAFFSGFQITERHPHAYRVSYYEKTVGNSRDNDLAGLDATVYVPLIDLKFTNDTPYWLLMETYIDTSAHRITWKFYSTKDGRSVTWQTSGPINIEKPEKPQYKENPELSKGEIEQVEWEAEGADVLVNRTVLMNGAILFEDNFSTHYEPWRAVYEYGPGTSGIPKENEDKD